MNSYLVPLRKVRYLSQYIKQNWLWKTPLRLPKDLEVPRHWKDSWEQRYLLPQAQSGTTPREQEGSELSASFKIFNFFGNLNLLALYESMNDTIHPRAGKGNNSWMIHCSCSNLKFQHFLILFGTIILRNRAIPLNMNTSGFQKTKKCRHIKVTCYLTNPDSSTVFPYTIFSCLYTTETHFMKAASPLMI